VKLKREHRALNNRQFKNTPVTDQEQSLATPYIYIPGEKDEDTPFGEGAHRAIQLQELHRYRILK
jgi:hypothetical protein